VSAVVQASVPLEVCLVKVPVSVVIVTKNEERNIQAALESVSDFEDIVVLDSFSDDATISICRRFTERVYQQDWQGYARQKQNAVDLAKKDWVLLLDADERVTPELKKELTVRLSDGSVYGYFIPRKNYFLGKWIRHGGWWPDYTLRLFRKDVSYVEPREVHEKVVVKGPTGRTENPLEHYTYATISDYLKKMERYASLSADELSGRKSLPFLSMLLSPGFVFFKMYLLRQGFRDGARGFMLAALYGFYTFVKYAKIWEKKSAD
jgi:glycosyltransferase involved in cell wall biosynthesis